MKLIVLYGTRPEAIKTAPVILEARRRAKDGVETVVVSTGQHREMLRPIVRLFGTQPDADLDIMQADQSLAGLTARAVERLDAVFAEHGPDAVLVQGDTTTAMCGALAAFYRGIPVGHIEAGLRTGDIASPFPEEANRRIVGQIARWHFAPTLAARDNLRRENLPHASMPGGALVVTGNTVIDALKIATAKVRESPSGDEHVAFARQWKSRAGGQVVLVTGHRRENFGEPFREFCGGLADIAKRFPKALVVYPVHLNPNVQRPVRELLDGIENVRLAPPADYPEFVELMTLADVIVTDSGGVQEEAPSLGVPVLVTRTTTERPEAVHAGAALLVGPDRGRILREVSRLLSDAGARDAMRVATNPYGDGNAAKRILDALA